MRYDFKKLYESISNEISKKVIDNSHNGTGYFDGIKKFKKNGWWRGIDNKGRHIIFFRNKSEWICIHERYDNDNGRLVVGTGYYFNGMLPESAIRSIQQFRDEGKWGMTLEFHLRSKYDQWNQAGADEFNAKEMKHEQAKLLELVA